MTSGQGGPPPGWGPEQGSPPPYGAPGPSYGQPPAQQWPAYPSAPPLPQPTYGGPVPTERPLTVRIGLGCFIGSLVLSAIAAVVTILNLDTIVADAMAHMNLQSGAGSEAAHSTAQAGAYVGLGLECVFIGAYAMFVLFAWRGRNWARIVLWVLGGLGLAGSLLSVIGHGSPVPFLTGISAFQGLLLLVAVVSLALKPSNDWFRYQGWLRATGQR